MHNSLYVVGRYRGHYTKPFIAGRWRRFGGIWTTWESLENTEVWIKPQKRWNTKMFPFEKLRGRYPVENWGTLPPGKLRERSPGKPRGSPPLENQGVSPPLENRGGVSPLPCKTEGTLPENPPGHFHKPPFSERNNMKGGIKNKGGWGRYKMNGCCIRT